MDKNKHHNYTRIYRGEGRLRILAFLKQAGAEWVDFFEMQQAFNGSIRHVEYIKKKITRRAEKRDRAYEEKRKVYSAIARLRHGGFIRKEDARWRITKTGIALYKKLISRHMPRLDYTKKQSETIMIITFDIPEKERRKRDWLREALRALGFTMLRQSVWAGVMGIPEDFIHDLEYLRIRDYVDIFSVDKQGMITH